MLDFVSRQCGIRVETSYGLIGSIGGSAGRILTQKDNTDKDVKMTVNTDTVGNLILYVKL